MKCFKILITVIIAITLCLIPEFGSAAKIHYDFQLRDQIPMGAEPEDYITLLSDSLEYEVQAGDTLWGISEKFLGTGTAYQDIFHANTEVIVDPDHIFPGQTLCISGRKYIPKDPYDRGGLRSEGAMHIASPDMVDHSMFLSTDIENYTRFQSGITIYSLPVKNRMGENALTNDWEAFVAEVTRCSETCEGRVSNLKFEKYEVEGGCDLCGYSFDFDADDKVLEFAAFFRLGKWNMAEVIGLREKEENSKLIDVTRYIAASFEDFGGQIGMGREKMGDNVGAWDWDYPELHNLFTAAMKNFIEYTPRPEQNQPGDYEIVWSEPAYEQAIRNLLVIMWGLDEEEEKEFRARPLMASDIDVISDMECSFQVYKKTGAKNTDEDGSSFVEVMISSDEHKETFNSEESMEHSLRNLKNFRSMEKLQIYASGAEQLDFSFFSGMPHLKELGIYTDGAVEDMTFLSDLHELRRLALSGMYHDDTNNQWLGFGGVTDLSALGACTDLRYLYLQTPQVTDYSFLAKCPNICTINLFGEVFIEQQALTNDSDEALDAEKSGGWEPVLPDLDLLPNARFIEFYGESIRFEP